MKFQDATRYEFREFGRDLTAARNAIAALGPGTEQEPSRETYIVTRLNIEANVKIRRSKLEVKGLRGRLQLLEQWQPMLATVLPVPAGAIEDLVAPALGINVDLDGTRASTSSARCSTSATARRSSASLRSTARSCTRLPARPSTRRRPTRSCSAQG
jgi:hypothetical protein